MRIALGVEYDGSRFNGWQSQPGGNTVQDVLQRALSGVAGVPVSVTAAGRTDTGVHALEQVVHFDTQVVRPSSAWVRGANAMLPAEVAVLWSAEVPEEFHARFSAQARSYQYVLLNRSSRSGVHHGKMGWFHAPLNLDAMRAAAALLVGTHDFTSFRAAECQAKSPIKHLSRLDIVQQGDVFIFELTANAFLHHMVRNIIGCLVYVGKGKYAPEWMGQVLDARNRSQAAPTFAPDGLYLRHITYDGEWHLPQVYD